MYCDRVGEDVELLQADGELTVRCRYFHRFAKGPGCRKILYGRLGWPLPTKGGLYRTAFMHLLLPIVDALRFDIGIGAPYPSWCCKVCKPEGPWTRKWMGKPGGGGDVSSEIAEGLSVASTLASHVGTNRTHMTDAGDAVDLL